MVWKVRCLIHLFTISIQYISISHSVCQCWVCRYLPDEDINNYIVSRIVEVVEGPVFNTFI